MSSAATYRLPLAFCGAGVGPTKVLSENPLCRSLSSIHILYNQAIVGEMGPLLASARWIANVQLPGGSIVWLVIRNSRTAAGQNAEIALPAPVDPWHCRTACRNQGESVGSHTASDAVCD